MAMLDCYHIDQSMGLRLVEAGCDESLCTGSGETDG